MSEGRGAEETGETDRVADERLLHEVDVPNEAGEQRTECEEDGSGVGAESPEHRAVNFVGHGTGHEGRPEPHQDSGDDAGDDALPRCRATGAREAAVGLAIQNHRDNRAEHSRCQECGIPFRVLRIAGNDADHQRDSNRDWKCNREAGHIDGRDQQ